jgi:RNA polymerase sigma factor (sigma-70 family)
MMTLDDMGLLRSYAANHSEEAFSALVSRHVNLVYAVALRVLRDSHQAEEVTQSVFLTLARKARGLDAATVLSGWLYQTARLTASNLVRAEMRRRQREHQAQIEGTMNDPKPDLWTQVGPQIEEAMAELNEQERDAIVLRFFEGKRLKEVGDALGTTEEAARMRVSRALVKLRTFFVRRGITMPEAALAAALAESSIMAAPAGLAASVTTGVLQGAAATASVPALLKGAFCTMSTAKMSVAIAVGAAAIIAVQWEQSALQKKSIQSLQEQLAMATQTSHAQQQEIQTLRDRVAANAKALEAMSHDAAKSRANAGAARDARRMAEAMRKAPLSALFQDPDMIKAMKEQSAAMVRMQYAPLVKQLHLSADQADKFYQILIDKSAQGIEAIQSGNLAAAATNSIEGNLKALLGESGFKQYTDYVASLADQTMLSMEKDSFVDDPLTDQQQQRLLQAMMNARQSINSSAGNPPNHSTLNAVGQAAIMDQAIAREEQINQSVLQQAADFLSPAQLQSLANSQSNWLGMEKVGMVVAQKMFTNAPSGTPPVPQSP